MAIDRQNFNRVFNELHGFIADNGNYIAETYANMKK